MALALLNNFMLETEEVLFFFREINFTEIHRENDFIEKCSYKVQTYFLNNKKYKPIFSWNQNTSQFDVVSTKIEIWNKK